MTHVIIHVDEYLYEMLSLIITRKEQRQEKEESKKDISIRWPHLKIEPPGHEAKKKNQVQNQTR